MSDVFRTLSDEDVAAIEQPGHANHYIPGALSERSGYSRRERLNERDHGQPVTLWTEPRKTAHEVTSDDGQHVISYTPAAMTIRERLFGVKP